MKKKGEKKYLTQLHEKKKKNGWIFIFAKNIIIFLFSFV